MTQELERQVISLVAIDRIYVPMSSFDGKLERMRPKLAREIDAADNFNGCYEGERAFARVVKEDKEKAKGLRAGVEEFKAEYPRYGAVLEGMIQKKRVDSERHLYFGMNPGKRLTQDDYMRVMQDIGLSPERAEQFYPVVMEISRNLSRKRGGEDRSVMIG